MLNACAGLLMGVGCLYLNLSADQALSAQNVTSNLQDSCADLLSECMHVSSSDPTEPCFKKITFSLTRCSPVYPN